MENRDYYCNLAERIFFFGLTPEGLAKIAALKPGKTFGDFVAAVKQGNLDGLGYFERQAAHVAERMAEVIEIDTRAYDTVHGTDRATLAADRFI